MIDTLAPLPNPNPDEATRRAEKSGRSWTLEWLDVCVEVHRENDDRYKNLMACLKFSELINPIDRRLQAIVDKYEPRYNYSHLGGMQRGALEMAKFLSPEWYKAAAAKKLLLVRHTRRWHQHVKGKPYTADCWLRDAAMCRGRAAGTVSMPNVKFISF